MTLISTLTEGGSSLTSTTSSTVMLGVIITCCIITASVLIFLLALKDVTSKSGSMDSRSKTALRFLYVPLIVTFCAFFVYMIVQFV